MFVLHVPFDTLAGVPYDLMGTYGISHTDIMDSVWHVVEAVSNYTQFQITYPSSVVEQEKIVAGFKKGRSVGFNVCAGAVDGNLIWMQKPNVNEAKSIGVDQRKFLCGRKHKFGLNCQAVADVNGKILDISVVYGASAADCVAFKASDLHARLEDGLLQNRFVLFGNYAYLNLFFMAPRHTPMCRAI